MEYSLAIRIDLQYILPQEVQMQRLDVLHHQVHHKEHRHRYKDSIMIDLNHYRRIDHRPIRDFICDFFIKLLEINWLDRNARAIDQKIKYNK